MRYHELTNAPGFTIHDGLPWAAEVANVMQGAPKVSRVPTGGWRSYGAIPSHGYPYSTQVPGVTAPMGGDYWQGIGQTASTDTSSAQASKTTEPTAMQSIAQMIAAVGTSAGQIYKTQTEYQIARQRIKAGQAVPQVQPTLNPGIYTPTQKDAEAQASATPKVPGWAIAAGIGAIGLVAFMAMGKKR